MGLNQELKRGVEVEDGVRVACCEKVRKTCVLLERQVDVCVRVCTDKLDLVCTPFVCRQAPQAPLEAICLSKILLTVSIGSRQH